jgi:hypothetical protein
MQFSSICKANGKLSKEYTLKQGVGQGRVLSSWFFLLMINDLISELDDLNVGPQVCNLHVPCVILADDTSLISNTPKNMQMQLNVVSEYASKWRLTYNPSKSCVMAFTNNQVHRQLVTDKRFYLGENT